MAGNENYQRIVDLAGKIQAESGGRLDGQAAFQIAYTTSERINLRRVAIIGGTMVLAGLLVNYFTGSKLLGVVAALGTLAFKQQVVDGVEYVINEFVTLPDLASGDAPTKKEAQDKMVAGESQGLVAGITAAVQTAVQTAIQATKQATKPESKWTPAQIAAAEAALVADKEQQGAEKEAAEKAKLDDKLVQLFAKAGK